MSLTAASPVLEGVAALILADSALVAATIGGWHSDVPQAPTWPFGWVEVPGEIESRGFGTGGLPTVDLRTHVFSQYGGLQEARTIDRLVVDLLKDALMPVTGYAQCGQVTYRETVTLTDEFINGVKCHEVVSSFTIWVEEA
jgi:hypothetical protein